MTPVLALYDSIHNKVIVDVGCGMGQLLGQLAQQRPRRAVGVDVSLPRLQRATTTLDTAGLATHRSHVALIQGDGNAIPLQTSCIDYVVSSVVLYLLDQQRALSEVSRVLKPGGYFTFTGTTGWYVIRRLVSRRSQPAESPRIRSIVGMIVILLNGLLYSYLGITPLLKRATGGLWYIYHQSRRLARDVETAGLVVLDRKTLTSWRGHPILFQWTARKPPYPANH